MSDKNCAKFREVQKPNQSSNQPSNQSTVENTYEKAKAEFYASRSKFQSPLDENGLPRDDRDTEYYNCL